MRRSTVLTIPLQLVFPDTLFLRWSLHERRSKSPSVLISLSLSFFSGKIDLKEAAVRAFKATTKYTNEVYVGLLNKSKAKVILCQFHILKVNNKLLPLELICYFFFQVISVWLDLSNCKLDFVFYEMVWYRMVQNWNEFQIWSLKKWSLLNVKVCLGSLMLEDKARSLSKTWVPVRCYTLVGLGITWLKKALS